MDTLPRKYALVTGASSGIGLQYARQLAARGYCPVLVSNRQEENERAAAGIAADYPVEVHSLCMDLSAADAARKLFEWTEEHGIEIAVLVCNAGLLLWGSLTDAAPERLQRIIALHCTTPTLLCRLYGDRMRTRGRGAILLMSSSTAWMPYPTIAAYAATKSYLRSFARSLHDELSLYGVTVTAVYPGAVDTPLYDLDEKRRKMLLRCGVMSTPESVARKGLRALFRGRRQCIPGFFTKVCVAACRLRPAAAMGAIIRIPAVRRLL